MTTSTMSPTKNFIEIGSCDFGTLNHLADYGWGGIIVEPVKEYLDNIPRKPGVWYVNSAIDTQQGLRTMNVFKKEYANVDRDFAGMSSFSEYTKEVNLDRVEPREVSTITYAELIGTYPIGSVDFLKIDTEGHDWVILQTVEFTGARRPKIIKLEYKHFRSYEDRVKRFLQEHDYLVYVEKDDMYAIDQRL